MNFAVETARSLDTPKRQSDALANVAGTFLALNQKQEGAAALHEAAQLTEGINDNYAKVFALSNLAVHFDKAGQADRARASLGRGRKTCRSNQRLWP